MRLLRHWPASAVPVAAAVELWAGVGGGYAIPPGQRPARLGRPGGGAFYAIFWGSALPTLLLYGYLCQRVRLSKLLFWGTLLAIPQMLPLLLVHSAVGALIAALPMGLTGGLASGAYIDLAIRSCPRVCKAP